MGGISVKLHREFSARASRGAATPPPPLARDAGLLETSEPRDFAARAIVGLSRALLRYSSSSYCSAGFFAGALAFAYLSRRW